MGEIAAWVAPAATMIAAMMVAGNFGTRITGWGFVVYTIGAVAWCVQGAVTGQTNLLWANGFLLVVDVIGIYRWLFRRVRLDEGAQRAEMRSRQTENPTLFPVGRLCEAPLCSGGETIGRIVDAMAERETGRLSYVVVSEGGAGGVGERLHALPWTQVRPVEGRFTTGFSADRLAKLPQIDPTDWPVAPPAA